MATIMTSKKLFLILTSLLTICLLSGCLFASHSLTTEELAKQWLKEGPDDTLRKYTGKTVELSGVVVSKKPYQDSSEVSLLLYENRQSQLLITVNFPPERLSDINAIKQGTFLTVKGTFYGVIGSKNGWNNIVIYNAKVVN